MSKNNENKLVPKLRFDEFQKNQIWAVRTLDHVAEVYQPKTISQTDLKDTGYLVYGANGVIGYYDQYNHETSQIAIACRGSSCGTVNFTAPKSWITGNAMVVNTDGFVDIDKKFLFYQLCASSFAYLITGSGQPQITGNVKKHKVAITNLQEQQKIAACLSSLDIVITAESQKLEVLKDHKKGLLQNLLPQAGETVPKYRFSKFRSPMQKVGFSELGEIKIGLTHKPDYTSYGVPFLSSKNISSGFIDFKNVQYISREKFDSMPESTKPKLGDILFTRVGSNLGNPIILEQDIEFGIFVSLGVFRVNEKAYNYYIKYWMESDLFWKQLNQKVAGGAKDNLNSTWLREFELYIPSIEEQKIIASTLGTVDDLIKAQNQKLEALQLHKKGLLQGLFPNVNEVTT